MSEIKLCKDCKYCVPKIRKIFFIKIIDYEFARCANPATYDKVTGDCGYFCSTSRNFGFLCGDVGNYWEAK